MLSSVSRELVDSLRRHNLTELRPLTLAARALAIQRADLYDPRAAAALDALSSGEIGDGPVRAQVRALTEELDALAWDLPDRIETGDAMVEYQVAFAQARAAASLDQALAADAVAAAFDAFYETHFAINDLPALLAFAQQGL